jgi:hypothetical protein
MSPVSPQNKIIVCFEKKYQDEIKTASGISFFKDTTFAPEWNATLTGRVESVPRRITIPGIRPEVEPGDEIAFSYWVVENKYPRPDSDDTFWEDSEPSSYNKHYTNKLKQSLSIQFMSKREAVGLFLDQSDELIEGCHGSPAKVEKWMSGFHFVRGDDMIYTNLLHHEDQEFWMVDYQEAIAVKREGKIIMIGGNVLLEPQEEHFTYEMDHERHLHLMAKIEYGVSTIAHIGKPLANSPDLYLWPGDRVHFNQRYVQKYEVWGKHYLLIPQNRILGQE